MRVVIVDQSGHSYYVGWYLNELGEPRIYTVYDDISNAKVLKMNGFTIHWGDHPPPDVIKDEIIRSWRIVPVKIVALS